MNLVKGLSIFAVSPLEQRPLMTGKFRSLYSICYLEYSKPWKLEESEPVEYKEECYRARGKHFNEAKLIALLEALLAKWNWLCMECSGAEPWGDYGQCIATSRHN